MRKEVEEFITKGFEKEENKTYSSILEGFSDEEINVIYDIVKYHRDSIMEESPDKPNHDEMVILITWVWESRMSRIRMFKNFLAYKNSGKKNICTVKKFYNRRVFINFLSSSY